MGFFSFRLGSIYSSALACVCLCVCVCMSVPMFVWHGVCFIVLLIPWPALGAQPDRNILSLSEDISLSCVLPLMEVCHRLEMQPFDVV